MSEDRCHICSAPTRSDCDVCGAWTCQLHLSNCRLQGLETRACDTCREMPPEVAEAARVRSYALPTSDEINRMVEDSLDRQTQPRGDEDAR